MTEQPIFLRPDDSIEYCAKEMDHHHIGAILVKDEEDILGVLTEQDIVRGCIAKGINPLDKKVKDFMEKELHTITPDVDIFDALIKMRDLNIRHLPVVDDKKLLGLLTLKDILKIEPQLFDLLVEEFELREEEKKPIHKINKDEGICQTCGDYAEELKQSNGVFVCSKCL
jgi:signal-transduction protein with cAMP-binding, CBS, and nucleotidyltransferase domain